MNRLFDLRFVIGTFFLIVGILLLGYSFLSTETINNLKTTNLWCGSVFIVFGIFMIVISSNKDADDDLLKKE